MLPQKIFLIKLVGTNFSGEQRIFISDCIKRVISERKGKDEKLKKYDFESIVSEVRKYTQLSDSFDQITTLMANTEYYNMLREYSKTFDDSEIPR